MRMRAISRRAALAAWGLAAAWITPSFAHDWSDNTLNDLRRARDEIESLLDQVPAISPKATTLRTMLARHNAQIARLI